MMEKTKQGARAAAHGLMREEYKAWLYFYQRVASDDQLAAEVLGQLEQDPLLKRDHFALYVRCKQSIRVHKARHRRNERIGEGVRALCHLVLVAPFKWLRNAGHHGGDIAVECLPWERDKPVGRLPRASAQESDQDAQPEVIPGAQAPDRSGSPRETKPRPSSKAKAGAL
jgi:hypothetical protein